MDKEEKKKDAVNLKKKLAECEREKEEYLNGWRRAQADFLNYKKKESERTKELIRFNNEKFILKLLPVLDNFSVAEENMPDDLKKDKWVEGILKIKNQISDFLKNQGVEEIKSLGEKFDPNFHEAIAMAEKKGKESGLIIEEIQKGYLLEGKVLRPAKVKVVK